MIVEWNNPDAGLLVVPVTIYDEETKQCLTSKHIKLFLGMNQVNDEDWPHMEKELKDKIEAGYIKPVFAKKEGKEKKLITSLKDLEPDEAEKVIKETFLRSTLESWLDSEGRDSVRASINKQIGTIEKKVKKAKN